MTERDDRALSDEEIVSLVREGDTERYSEIIRRYEAKLTRYIGRFIYNTDERADVLQEVFIKAYRNLHGFKTSLKFSSWIYRIAHNEAINVLRKANRVEIFLDTPEYERIKADINIEGDIDAIFKKEQLEDALEAIDVRYREPITLFYFDEMSYEEISDVMHIPKNTVGTYISRGKKALKEYFRQTA
jgi:RNA polymerase sigma-70 factor (ECF subfamily)